MKIFEISNTTWIWIQLIEPLWCFVSSAHFPDAWKQLQIINGSGESWNKVRTFSLAVSCIVSVSPCYHQTFLALFGVSLSPESYFLSCHNCRCQAQNILFFTVLQMRATFIIILQVCFSYGEYLYGTPPNGKLVWVNDFLLESIFYNFLSSWYPHNDHLRKLKNTILFRRDMRTFANVTIDWSPGALGDFAIPECHDWRVRRVRRPSIEKFTWK